MLKNGGYCDAITIKEKEIYFKLSFNSVSCQEYENMQVQQIT